MIRENVKHHISKYRQNIEIVPLIHVRYVCGNRNRTNPLHSIKSNEVALRRVHDAVLNNGIVNPHEMVKIAVHGAYTNIHKIQ